MTEGEGLPCPQRHAGLCGACRLHSGSPCLVVAGPPWGPGRAHPGPRPSRRPVAAHSTGRDRSSVVPAVSAPAPCPSTSSSQCGESESRDGVVPSCPPPRLVLQWPGLSLWGRPCLGVPAAGTVTSGGDRAWGSWGPSLGGGQWTCGGQLGCALSPRVLQNCHDDAAKFVHLLVSPGCSYLVQEDFVPFLQVRARGPPRAPLPCVPAVHHTCLCPCVAALRTAHPPLHLPTTRMSHLCCTHPHPFHRRVPMSTPACGSLAL